MRFSLVDIDKLVHNLFILMFNSVDFFISMILLGLRECGFVGAIGLMSRDL